MLSGSAGSFRATVTYSDGTIYFALKIEGFGDGSDLSNNAFWPSIDVYLPVIIKKEFEFYRSGTILSG